MKTFFTIIYEKRDLQNLVLSLVSAEFDYKVKFNKKNNYTNVEFKCDPDREEFNEICDNYYILEKNNNK